MGVYFPLHVSICISRALNEGCLWLECFGSGGKAAYFPSNGGMLRNKEEPFLLLAHASIIFHWGLWGLCGRCDFSSAVQAVFALCNGLLPKSYLLALAAVGHLGRKLPSFPERAEACTHTQSSLNNNLCIFFLLFPPFPHTDNYSSSYPPLYHPCFALHTSYKLPPSSIVSKYWKRLPPPKGFSRSLPVDGVVAACCLWVHSCAGQTFSLAGIDKIWCRHKMGNFIFPVYKQWYTWQRVGYFTDYFMPIFRLCSIKKKKY